MEQAQTSDQQQQARKEQFRKYFAAYRELSDKIPEKCGECSEVKVSALGLANRVSREQISLDDAVANIAHNTEECKGVIPQTGVYDGHPDCWRKQQLGRPGRLMGRSAFTDL